MLAVGPPRSLIVPEKPGSSAMRRISARIDSRLRLWMMRPSWTVIEQNVQPPKQPRMIWIESFTTSNAGIRCAAVARVRPPRERQAVDAVDLLLRQRPGRAD